MAVSHRAALLSVLALLLAAGLAAAYHAVSSSAAGNAPRRVDWSAGSNAGDQRVTTTVGAATGSAIVARNVSSRVRTSGAAVAACQVGNSAVVAQGNVTAPGGESRDVSVIARASQGCGARAGP